MGKTLAQLRCEKRKTQKEVADDLGLAISTIGMYERGYRTPSLKSAKRLAKYFDTKIEDIQFGKKETKEPNAPDGRKKPDGNER